MRSDRRAALFIGLVCHLYVSSVSTRSVCLRCVICQIEILHTVLLLRPI